jgi:hypothetical protein
VCLCIGVWVCIVGAFFPQRGEKGVVLLGEVGAECGGDEVGDGE